MNQGEQRTKVGEMTTNIIADQDTQAQEISQYTIQDLPSMIREVVK